MMKKVHTVFGILLVLIIYATCSTLQYSRANGTVDKSEAFHCKCKNGFCEKDKNGKLVCKCPPEYGPFASECFKCNCGKGANCTWSGMFGNTKNCLCRKGYTDVKGTCKGDCKQNPCENGGTCRVVGKDITCGCVSPYSGENCKEDRCVVKCGDGPDIKCEVSQESDETTTCGCKSETQIFDAKEKICKECYCGIKTEKCEFIDDIKTCTCQTGYSQNKGVCEICDCGTNSVKCEFIEDIKTCTCAIGFSEKRGACEECSCGLNAEKCEFIEDIKKCTCATGFSDNKGICEEWTCTSDSDCKNEAKCREENEDNKKCECIPGTMGIACDIITECLEGGKYENCKGQGGSCSFEDGNAVCKCSDSKILDEGVGYCKDWKCTSDIDCKNEAICEEEAEDNNTKCQCRPGTTGNACDIVMECMKGGKYEKCKGEAGNCNFENGEAVCKCPENKIFDERIGYCKEWTCVSDTDCKNEARCRGESENSKKCKCKPGTKGNMCDIVTECVEGGKYENCKEEAGNCDFADGIAVCKCPESKILDVDAGYCKASIPCNPNPCKNNGDCVVDGAKFHCICKYGYSGETCEIATTPCNPNPCKHKGDCSVDGAKVKCICKNGYRGETCDIEWPCGTDSVCKNEAICEEDFEGEKKCICKAGTMGETCDIIIECETGGIYENCKGGNGNCTYEYGYVVCKCSEGKILDEVARHCKDQCNPNMCENGGECIVVEGEMKCKCKAPYSGDRCETKCRCENGLCVMDKHGKMKCACNPKHSLTDDETCKPCDCGNKGKCIFQMKVLNGSIQYWKMCVCNKGSAEKDGKCVDCNCGPNSLCEFEGVEKHCYCEEGYTEKDGVCTGLCTVNPCKNGGTCVIRENGYKCICKDQYFGKICEMGPCADNPCKNGGTCEVVGDDYNCTCKDPYFGKMCEMDSCTPNPCQNGGTCFMDGNMFRCSCMDLVSGTTCEIDNRFLLAALILLVVLVFLIIICGGCCLFKIKQKISQNFQP